MTILSRLERKFGRYPLPNPQNYLIAVQAVLYLWNLFANPMGHRDIHELVALIPARVLEGEVWRLATFLFEPPRTSPIWAFFYWYLIYFFANTLEYHWGSFRLNVYIAVGWLATVLVALLLPELRHVPVTNGYLYASLFLAFAFLYPEFELNIFFVLPVKVKWLALVAWLGMAYNVFAGGWTGFWMALPTVADFLLFFGIDLWHRARHWWRGRRYQQRVAQAGQAALYHECRVCGLTSQMSPRTQFRYCSKCDDQACYCPEHVANHEHVGGAATEAEAASETI